MNDIFGLLSYQQWLGILRIAIGLWWIKSVLHKPFRQFVGGQMADWTLALADNHPVPAFSGLVRKLVEPNRSWFPYLILFSETAVGLGLTFGFLTPIAAVGGIFLNFSYLSLAGAKPKDKSVNPGYQCEQGQNLLMIVSEIVIIVLAAGANWSLDGMIGLF